MSYLIVKRLIDIIFSLVALIILLPVFLIIAVVIKLDSKGKVLFKQERIGAHKTRFKLIKFRTMRTDAPSDTPTHMLKNPNLWITKVGSFLRKTSLDELPQIINIIKGDMSIIGPRPALWNQGDLILERDNYVGKYSLTPNMIRPGLTGWAQINGRDTLTISEKAKLDGEYVKKMSLSFDIKCFMLTIKAVIIKDGFTEGANETAK